MMAISRTRTTPRYGHYSAGNNTLLFNNYDYMAQDPARLARQARLASLTAAFVASGMSASEATAAAIEADARLDAAKGAAR